MRASRARGQTPCGRRTEQGSEVRICVPSATPCNDSAKNLRINRRNARVPPKPDVDSLSKRFEGDSERSRPIMAATNINRVVLTGNLTRDPDLRSLPSGSSVCSLRIASNTRRKDNPASGSTSPTTSASPSGAPRARTASRFLSKGRPVAIDGRLEWREWTDKEGNKRESVEIIADSVQFLGCRPRAAAAAPTTAAAAERVRPALRRPGRHVGLRRPSPSAPATARRPTTTSRSRPVSAVAAATAAATS